MGILLFLIDTSASMALKTYLGTSYLDVAKAAVETFMKVGKFWKLVKTITKIVLFACLCHSQYRMRDPASRGDRYMLVTFDEPPYSVKVSTLSSKAGTVQSSVETFLSVFKAGQFFQNQYMLTWRKNPDQALYSSCHAFRKFLFEYRYYFCNKKLWFPFIYRVCFVTQSGWKENHSTFVAELKALQATGLSNFSVSVREAFKLLNIHRLHTGIENYGQVTPTRNSTIRLYVIIKFRVAIRFIWNQLW